MSNHDHLRPVTLPPALANVTTCRLLPSPSSGKLLVPLLNEWHCQALHVCQLLGGTSQLQSPFTDCFGDPDGIHFGIELLQLCIDTGQVIIQFVVACDICSNAPVIKLVGCFGQVSVNGGGSSE